MTTTIETKAHVSIPHRHLAVYGGLAVVFSILVNGSVRLIARSIFGVPAGYGPLEWGPIVTTTIVAATAATLVITLLVRISNRPFTQFLRVATVVLLLSFAPLLVPPAFLAEAPVSVFVTLGLMHLTTAAVVIGLFRHLLGHGVRP